MVQPSSTRNLILDQAVRIASREGLEGVTIGALAKIVGLSKSGLLFHFKSKDRLKQMVVQRAADNFTDKVLRPAFKQPRGEPRVRALFENWLGYLDLSSDQPEASLLISASTEVNQQPGALRDLVQSVQRDLVRNIEKAIEIAVSEGHFVPQTEPPRMAWELYSFVLGYYHFHQTLEDGNSRQYVNNAYQELIRGVRSPDFKEVL